MDMYASSCQQVSMSSDQFHDKGKEMAITELASLYEYVCKMPDGPQKHHFLKKVSTYLYNNNYIYCINSLDPVLR